MSPAMSSSGRSKSRKDVAPGEDADHAAVVDHGDAADVVFDQAVHHLVDRRRRRHDHRVRRRHVTYLHWRCCRWAGSGAAPTHWRGRAAEAPEAGHVQIVVVTKGQRDRPDERRVGAVA
jgi:hypothetical protein